MQYLGAKPIISASFEGGTIITDWYHEGHQDIKLNIIITTNKDQEGDLIIKAFSRIHTRNIITQANSANEDPKFAEKIRLEILENLECN